MLAKRYSRNVSRRLRDVFSEVCNLGALGYSLGVENPSPLNTWPKCPPHAVQVISVLWRI